MSRSEFPVSEMTPLVREFFNRWFCAQTCYGHLKNGRAPDIQREVYMKNLETGLAEFNAARAKRDEAHPEAHLMLMLTVKGGWFARWRAELKGANLWKDNCERFEIEYQDFMRFYRKTHKLNES
jgi:hypothetical protein